MNCKIINNLPCCPITNKVSGRLTGNTRVVKHVDETYIEIERFCDCGCRKKYTYQCIITLDETKRFTIDDLTEIKDEESNND